MVTVSKKTVTKPMPAEARIILRKGEQFAEWIDAKQKRRTAHVPRARTVRTDVHDHTMA